jgi:hypothetical protein
VSEEEDMLAALFSFEEPKIVDEVFVPMPRPRPRKLRCIMWRGEVAGLERIYMRTDWHETFKDEFKALVPGELRSWNDQTKMPPKVWHFDPGWLEQVYSLSARYFEVTVLDNVTPVQASTSKLLAGSMPEPKPVQSVEELRAELQLTTVGHRKIDL